MNKPTTPVTMPEGDSGRGQVRYVGPDTYILRDAEGRTQAMPGMSYEDFMAAWKRAQNLDTRSRDRRFSAEHLAIRGRAMDRHAELHLVLKVRLLTQGSVVVPIGLAGAILKQQPSFERISTNVHDGAKASHDEKSVIEQSYLDYDPQQGGFVAGFSGISGEEHAISLDLLVPIEQDGLSRTLQLTCPRALTAQLALEVDPTVAAATVSEGSVLSRVQTTDGGTLLNVSGLGGQFRLTWNTAEINADEPATALSATGAILVSIDGRSVQTEARLIVQSFGGEFDRFRVQLPPGAKLLRHLQPQSIASNIERGMQVRVEPESAQEGTSPGAKRQIVQVELSEKQPGPVEISLVTEQPLGLDNEESAVELAGFEVLGAVRQFGDVVLQAVDDWQLRWEAGRNVRQVDPVDVTATLQQPGITAAFQYDQQPWSLGVRMATKRSRIHVTPEYELECLPDEARLRVRLAYQVLGARSFEFRVDLQGWELTADPIESGGLVDRDRVLLTREGILVLPLVQASSRRAELSFQARRATPQDTGTLHLPLPVPQANLIGTGVLVVRAATGIDLIPDPSQSRGLAPVPITEEADGHAVLDSLRFRSFLPNGLFVTQRIIRPRDVSSEVATEIDLVPPEAHVIQQVDYTVRFEPMNELLFEVPEELLSTDDAVEVTLLRPEIAELGGQARETPLSLLPSADGLAKGEGGRSRLLRAALPQPRMGAFSVRIDYAIAVPGERPHGALRLHLVQPADGQLKGQQAHVQTSREVSVSLDSSVSGSSWQVLSQSARAATPPGFFATREEAVLPLIVRAVDVNSPSSTTIERVWLQTWLTNNARQDRAAYRFRSTGSTVTIELPPDTATEEVEVLLDGEQPLIPAKEAGRLVVTLPDKMESNQPDNPRPGAIAPHTLELRYRHSASAGVVSRRQFSPPQLVGMAALSEVYWQIILPGDMHVIRSPEQLTSVSQWQWLGVFWGQRPTKSQADLEKWVGATVLNAPAGRQHEYLFSGLAPMASIEVVTAPRWLIVLVASAAALALGLSWVYVPGVRRDWVVLGVACVIAGMAAAFPAPALLLGQAAVLGVVSALLAATISRLLARPARWVEPVKGLGSSLRPPAPRPESSVLSSIGSAASTAPTQPMFSSESEQ
jgi:hypothetical protein